MMRSVRRPGETDGELTAEYERMAVIAKALIEACFANLDVQEMIADPDDPLTEESVRRNPVVRIDYDEAFAVACIGEGLAATKNKHWGDGPNILPLEPEDPVKGRHILYVFKENSLYNRRFQQRMKLKELLGRKYRKLVTQAKRVPLSRFLEELSAQHSFVIRLMIGINAQQFWRLVKGNDFGELPDEPLARVTAKDLLWVNDKPRQKRLF